jgi:hypothetical protein
MNRTPQSLQYAETHQHRQSHPASPARSALRGMKKILATALLGAAFGAVPAAHASVIDFEGDDLPTLVGHLESFSTAGLVLTGYSVDDAAYPGDSVGLIVDGSDSGVCAGAACPTNNSSHYYMGLNDGAVFIDPGTAGSTFKVSSFEASFIGTDASATYPAVAGLLRVQGFYGDQTIYEDFALVGGASGVQFQSYTTSALFSSLAFDEVAIFGFVCDSAGSCSAFSTNQGQFGIDNINVAMTSAVPEPSSYLMMMLGLAGVGAAARRRKLASRGEMSGTSISL